MGIMSFLRNRMGLILVIFIGFALFAFIAGEVIQSAGSFFQGDQNTIAVVAGEKIHRTVQAAIGPGWFNPSNYKLYTGKRLEPDG